jgi:hypothetical protein
MNWRHAALFTAMVMGMAKGWGLELDQYESAITERVQYDAAKSEVTSRRLVLVPKVFGRLVGVTGQGSDARFLFEDADGVIRDVPVPKEANFRLERHGELVDVRRQGGWERSRTKGK